jgi:hypothetical protein
MKACPQCGGEILDAAIRCKHCHAMLEVAPTRPSRLYTPGGMVVAFLCVGPFMLPLVWRNPTLSRAQKAVGTFIVVLVTTLLIGLVVYAVGIWLDLYRELTHLRRRY